MRIAVVLGLSVLTVAVIVSSVLPARARVRATEAMLRAQEDENVRLQQRVDDLEAESHALRTDPWLLQRITRDEMHVTDENEVIVR